MSAWFWSRTEIEVSRPDTMGQLDVASKRACTLSLGVTFEFGSGIPGREQADVSRRAGYRPYDRDRLRSRHNRTAFCGKITDPGLDEVLQARFILNWRKE